jgi:ribosomal protein L31E
MLRPVKTPSFRLKPAIGTEIWSEGEVLNNLPTTNIRIFEISATIRLRKLMYKSGTQFDTQKCAERAGKAVDAVRLFLWKLSGC